MLGMQGSDKEKIVEEENEEEELELEENEKK